MIPIHSAGCAGDCSQGRKPCVCDRWDGTSRDTRPGDLLPVTPDPAVGISDAKVAGWALTVFVAAFGAYVIAIVQGWL